MVIELSPVTKWLPMDRPIARSGESTVADAMHSLSIADRCESSEESKDTQGGRTEAPAFGLPSASRARAGTGTQPEENALWRPSPKVAAGACAGAGAGGKSESLSEQGALALQGNLQVTGKVVFILEAKHRVSNIWGDGMGVDLSARRLLPCLFCFRPSWRSG